MPKQHDLTLAVRQNVVDIHVFFVHWFRGTIAKNALETGFLQHLSPEFFYVPPSGILVAKAQMAEMFLAGHGTNPALEIDIMDVSIHQDLGDHLLVSYRECQRGAVPPDAPRNERLSTLVLTKAQPFTWLSVHETTISA